MSTIQMSAPEHPEVLQALDGEWRTSRQVHARLGMWTPTTVRNMLLDLARAGAVDVTTRPTSSGFVRLYRTKSP